MGCFKPPISRGSASDNPSYASDVSNERHSVVTLSLRAKNSTSLAEIRLKVKCLLLSQFNRVGFLMITVLVTNGFLKIETKSKRVNIFFQTRKRQRTPFFLKVLHAIRSTNKCLASEQWQRIGLHSIMWLISRTNYCEKAKYINMKTYHLECFRQVSVHSSQISIKNKQTAEHAYTSDGSIYRYRIVSSTSIVAPSSREIDNTLRTRPSCNFTTNIFLCSSRWHYFGLIP